MKTRGLRKIISLISSFSLLLQSFVPLAIAMPVYAEDASGAAVIELSPSLEPTPEVTPEITPEVTPESTPTPEVSPEPTVIPTPTVEVTPEVSVTPEPTQEPAPAEQQNNQEPQNNSPPAETPTPTPAPIVSLPENLNVLTNLELGVTEIKPTLSTDKSDYFPTDTVYVTGTGFESNTTYIFHIFSSDRPAFSTSPEITADENGNISFSFRLDGNYRPNYTIEAIDSSNNIVSSYSFLDDRSFVEVLVNGGLTATVTPSSPISVDIEINTSGSGEGDEWESTQYTIEGKTAVCDNNPNTKSDDNGVTSTFSLTAPTELGTYDLTVKAFSDNNCTNQSNTRIITDAIVVNSSSTSQPTLPNNPSDDYALTSVSGVWTSVTGGSNVTGINTEEVRWGTTTGQKSGLRFDGSGVQTFNTGATFYLGALTHFNYPIQNPSSGAKLRITLQFSKPTISPNPNLSYDFVIDETSNIWPCNSGWQVSNTACDDRVRFPSSYGSTSFQLEDKLYTLRIDGFVNSYPTGNPISQFVTQEDRNNTAYLVGSLSSVLVSAPQISLVEKAVNGNDADSTPGENLYVGDTATFTYSVQNTGNVSMTSVSVIDDKGVTVTCPKTTLASGESMTCTGSSTVVVGQYTNTAHIHGTYNGTVYQSNNESANYFGVVRNICGDGNKSASEACDNGVNNGTVCTPTYGGTCTYCSVSCAVQTVTGPKCGDYNIDSGETCDDGNIMSGDRCSSTCQIETWCGDGIKNGSEACDGTDLGGLSSSNFSCNSCALELIEPKVTICHSKDSQKNPYEQNEPNKSADVSGHDGHDGGVWYLGIADHSWGDIIPPFDYIGGHYDGQNWTTEGQTIWNNQCEIAAYCGDGKLNQESETCDDGNLVNGDHCSSTCQIEEWCGDTIVNGSEQCEGNSSTACTVEGYNGTKSCIANSCNWGECSPSEYCGDEVKNGTEQCDTADGVGAHQTCTETCTLENVPFCGDGIKNQDSEACDGISGVTVGSNFCSTSCKLVPIYSGNNVCSEGKVRGEKVASKTISSSSATGEVLGLTSGKEYLFEASQTFNPTSAPGYLSDAAFTWVNDVLSSAYGINGTGNDLGAHALLGNLGLGVGIIKWNNSAEHTYTFAYTPTNSSQQFVIGDRYDDWFNTPYQNQSGVNDNTGSLNLDVYECILNQGTVSGIKYSDLNGNGYKDSEETGLSGWTIKLLNETGNSEIASTTTTTDGSYSFQNVNAGNYQVCEINQTGWKNTEPGAGVATQACKEIIVTAANNSVANFGNQQLSVIKVTKYNDSDGSGSRNGSEVVLGNWTINLSNGSSAVTGEDGIASFTDLNPNTEYTISETIQDGWYQTGITCDINSSEGTTQITAPGEAYGHHGNCSGWNGCTDAATCAQWACEVKGYDHVVSYGDARPCTQFGNCNLFNSQGSVQYNWGNWCPVMGVTDIVCSGTKSSSSSKVTVKPGEVANCSIGNRQYGSVSGYKWDDQNGNHEMDCELSEDRNMSEEDSCEPKLESWKIFIDKNGDGQFNEGETSVNTDESGNYQFTSLVPGTYSICEENQTGWTRFYPENSNCHSVTVNEGRNTGNINFGNHRVEPVLSISRSNNASLALAPGGSVEHTITIKVTENNVKNLKLTDLLPNGFSFSGSYSVSSVQRGSITLANNPEYHSPGVWELGDYDKDDVITIKYLANSSSEILPGTYTDLAYAIANDAYGQGLSFLALGENSEYVDENYVGTDVEVVKDQTNGEDYKVEKEEIKGTVLGASTSLPATGASPMWLMLAFVSLVYGIRLIKSSNKK